MTLNIPFHQKHKTLNYLKTTLKLKVSLLDMSAFADEKLHFWDETATMGFNFNQCGPDIPWL